MYQCSPGHREDVSVAALNYPIGLWDSRVRALVRVRPELARGRNFLRVVGIDETNSGTPLTNEAIKCETGVVSGLGTHGERHLKACRDIFHDEHMSRTIAPNGPI